MLRALRLALAKPFVHVTFLTALVGVVLLRTQVFPLDDHFHYQAFMEALAQGKMDFSIPGFHGASFLAFPLFLLTHSPLTNIYFQVFCAALLIPAAYLAASTILRERVQTILFVYAVALMPFLFFFAFRGFTFASFTLCLFLTLWLRGRGSVWAWLPLGISLLIKPFSIALVPLFLFWRPAGEKKQSWNRGWVQLCLALILPALYFGAEYLQIGRIIIGAHAGLDQSNVFHWWRLPLNAAHGIQMMFSIHNFYFPDPAKTGLANMTHSSPILLMLGVLSLFHPKEFWKDRRLAGALLLSATLAFLLAAALDHMDHFYMETCVILLTLASIPALVRYPLMIPLALATFHFQFFYLYLQYRGKFFTDTSLFWIPLCIDVIAVVTCLVLLRWRQFVERFR